MNYLADGSVSGNGNNGMYADIRTTFEFDSFVQNCIVFQYVSIYLNVSCM